MIGWIDTILQGVLLGGLYALFALGLSLIFGIMRLVNLAHGDLIVLGAFLPRGLGTLLVTLATGAILVYQWFVIRTALQTTGGVALMLLLVDLVITSTINIGADRIL